MPRIPVYERQIERTSQAEASYSLAGERSSPLRIQPLASEYEGLQSFSEAVTRIGERLRKADQVERFSRALIEANDGIARIGREIEEDPALSDAAPEEYERRYQERADELRSTITARIRDAETRSAIEHRFAEKALDGRIRARALGRDRMIQRGRAATDAQLDSLVDSFVRGGDPSALAEGEAIIATKQAVGYFSPAEAQELRRRFARSATVGYWERRILDSPRLAYETLRQTPESVQALDEADRTRLLARAREQGERAGRDEVRREVYAELKSRFGRNVQAAIEHLENPNNYRDMDLDDRRYLIATFDAEVTRARERENHARTAAARAERRQVVELIRSGDYDRAVELASASEHLPGEFVEHVYSVARKGKSADVTDPAVRAALTAGIHTGQVSTEEQIDRYRLRGLSNDDADALVRRVNSPERAYYRDALKYAEEKYRAMFPAKDDREKHLRWFEFVDHVDRELTATERERGRRLSSSEARRIVDSWIDPQVEERAFWFDRKITPFFDRPSAQEDGRALRGIPPEDVQRIERILLGLGAKLTPENILQYWRNNQLEFTRGGR